MNRIVPAAGRDAAEIIALQRLAYQSEALLYHDWSIPPLTQSLADLEQELTAATCLKLCDAGGRIIGSVRAVLRGRTCHLGRLIVHPAFQRQGLGTRLMTAIEAAFPQAERFELFTGSRSAGNIRLYERLGYRIFHRQPLSPQVELVVLEKWRPAAGAPPGKKTGSGPGVDTLQALD